MFKKELKKIAAAAVAAAMTFTVGCTAEKDGTGKEEITDNPLRDHTKSEAGNKPNIVLIVADDLGYGDTSLYGHSIVTPNIQSIADNGVLMTQGYVTAPVCAPSRVSLMTSLYPAKVGADNSYSARNSMDRVPNNTIASLLKDKGYSTMAIGKWDLGGTSETMPASRGFESFYGIKGGMTSYYQKGPNKVPSDGWHIDKNNKAVKGGTIQAKTGQNIYEYNPAANSYLNVSEKEYMTDGLTREALDYIDNKASVQNPFFLYLSYNAPHVPLQAPDDHVMKYSNITNVKTRLYYAMVDSLDEQIGRVLKKLDEKGISKNTMVIFVSDNGPEVGSSGGLKGKKTEIYEGGIHVPFAIQWPEQYGKSIKFDKIVTTVDILPTAAAAAGYDVNELKRKYNLDGVDITPFIQGKATGNTHNEFYWRTFNENKELQIAIRSGDFKYITVTDINDVKMEYLFNIYTDPKEQNNLIGKAESKSIHEALKSALEKWHKDNPMNPNLGDGTDEEEEE